MAQSNNQQQMQGGEMLSLNRQIAVLSSKTTQWITDNLSNPMMGVSLPKGYNVGNEVAGLMYAIGKAKDKNGRSALEICSPEQVMNEIRDCVFQGLSIYKKHIWVIIYDGSLSLQRSYYGTVAALSYMFPWLRVYANVIYEGDVYSFCTSPEGYDYIEDMHSSLENHDKAILGAYGNIIDTRTGERVYGCVMTKKEIDANWEKSKSKDRTVQKEFPQEMAKRTLINRMCKLFVNSGVNANSEVVGAFNRMTEAEYINVTPSEEEKDRQKLLHSRSQGGEALKKILREDEAKAEKKEAEKAPQNAQEEKKPEITQEAPKNAPVKGETPSKSTLGRKPSVELDQWGNPVPTQDDQEVIGPDGELYSDSLPF